MKKYTPGIPYIAVLIGMYLFHNAWAAILLYHLGLLTTLILDKEKHYLSKVYKGWRWNLGIPILLISLLGGILIYFLWPYMAFDKEGLFRLLSEYGLKDTSWIIFMVYFALIHPPLEQIFWRGFLYHPSPKIHYLDICFAGYHFLTMIAFVTWPWAILSVIILTGTAWFWRQLVRWTDGLLLPILSHLIADICVITAVVLLTA